MSDNLTPPPSIKRAVKCIWASYGTTVLSIVLLFFAPTPQGIISETEKLGISVTYYTTIRLLSILIQGGIVYFITFNIRKGENWARIVCLIFGVIVLPGTILRVMANSSGDPTIMGISVVINTLYLGFGYYALYLFFASPGKTWFQKNTQPDSGGIAQ